MSKVKFEAELSSKQFDKFTDFMTWLKNDNNFNDGSDTVNKNDLLARKDTDNKIKQVLSDYNDFLLNNGYTDDDIITEHPTALERFLNLDK